MILERIGIDFIKLYHVYIYIYNVYSQDLEVGGEMF